MSSPGVFSSSAEKVRADLALALNILRRPGSAWTESLVTSGEPGPIAAPLLSAISRGSAFALRLAHAPVPPVSRVGFGSIADVVKLPIFSVNTNVGDRIVSTTVGGCVGELLFGVVMEETSPGVCTVGRQFGTKEQPGTFCGGFFVMDNDTGESLHIIHTVVPECHPQHGFTYVLHHSYPNTRTRFEISIICRTELFVAGFYESSAYISRSFSQTRPCICCGLETGSEPCVCSLTDVFKRPKHSLDFSEFARVMAAHCYSGVGPSIACSHQRSAAFNKMPELMKSVQDYWRDVGEPVSCPMGSTAGASSVNMNGSSGQYPVLRLRSLFHGTVFPNGHHRVTEIIQRATQVLTACGTPARTISGLLSTSSGCSEKAEGPVDAELNALNTKLIFPDFSVEPTIEIEQPKSPTMPSPAVSLFLNCAQETHEVSLAGGRNENISGVTPGKHGPSAASVEVKCVSDSGLAAGSCGVPLNSPAEDTAVQDAKQETRLEKRRQLNRVTAIRSYRRRVERDKMREEEVAEARATVAGLEARKQALTDENLKLKNQVAELWKDHIRRSKASAE